MSEFKTTLQSDPASLIFIQCEDRNEKRIEIDLNVLSNQLGTDYDLRTLAMDGQIRLFDKAEKYGALFLSFASYLIVLSNDQLYPMVNGGVFPDKENLKVVKFD